LKGINEKQKECADHSLNIIITNQA